MKDRRGDPNRIRRAVIALAVAAGGVTSPGYPSRVTGQAQAPDLRSIFTPGTLWQDRNGDGVIDFVAARLVLDENAGLATVIAATDVAARLGFETSAMNLPVARTGDTAGFVVVGEAGAARAGIRDLALSDLASGEGLVLVRSTATGPAVIAVGRDDAGTRAAAALLAGRLPFLDKPGGTSLDTLTDDLRKVLDTAKVTVRDIRVPSVRGTGAGAPITRIDVDVRLDSAADVDTARRALAQLRATGSTTPRAAAKPPAPSPARASETEEKPPRPALSYHGVRLVRVRLLGPSGSAVQVDVAPAETDRPAPTPARPGSGAKETLDLSNLYTPDGLFGDSDSNLISDRLDAVLVPNGSGVNRIIDLGARLGLESAGLVVPVAQPADSIDDPSSQPTMVLIGTSHPIVDRLVKDKKVEIPSLQPGEGLIQVVPKAFGDKRAVIVTGGDQAGLDQALVQLSERLPHIWARGKDRTTIEDVEESARRFVAARSPEGQAATALYRLGRIGRELQGRALASAEVSMHVEKAAPGLADFVRREAASALGLSNVAVTIDDLDVQKAGKIFDDEFVVTSEVDEFWRIFNDRVLAAVRRNQPVRMEVRLSEPPEIRDRIAREATQKLIDAGAAKTGTSVTVLSAFKQGYSWIYDVIRPQLEGRAIGEITIAFAEAGPPPQWTQQAMYAPTRWLLELYPIAEVMARDLKLDPKKVVFQKRPVGSPTYEVVATAPDGKEILRRTFEPKYVVRPFFDRFPEYEHVRVTTGWINALVGDRTVADERIVTDPERFWDYYQSKVLPRIYDYVMKIGEGKPEPGDAPYFGELVVELTLSEPDYPIGIDKEHIAPMESLHEEIYFNTLHFFDVLGRNARGEGLDYPGRVIPIVRPKSDGRPGLAKISFTGFKSIRPAVVVTYTDASGSKGTIRRDVRPIAVERPSATAARVRAGTNGLTRLDLRLKVDSEKEERAALVRRTRAERVDEQIISAEQVQGVVAALAKLRTAGLYRDAMAFHDLGEIAVTAAWTHDVDPSAQVVAALLPNGQAQPWPDIRSLLPAGYKHHAGETLVQWDTPIPPDEAYAILAKMSTFAEATVYKVGESYLGKNIWAMDLMPRIEASHWSQAKATTLKPTVVYSARQHANEVSSTSHVLKLAELLLTDPKFREKLKKVNVVIHPITNPDGAKLAYDLHKITPDHMLHAGYLGSLGVDMTSGQWSGDPIYPETRVRPDLWRTWLPDIFLNPHGYPSHEWVQLFSEYAGWVRNRATESRDWWTMRGWFMPGFGYLDDAKYPRHKDAAFEIRRRITENINAAPEVKALNARAYARYERYGFAQDDENFKLDFTNDVLIYTAIKGSKASAQASDFMARNPKVTIWTGGTEAPDETAYGDWMKLVATAGLQWDKAILDYLVEGRHAVERKGQTFFGGAAMSLDRPRPPKPEAEKKEQTSANQGR
ncbi:MAG TPA: M14 family metallopeptidase [Vicinamibacterales bacterium]|nr:M14 family metallopeptidase [Vicinamibacterales bacterium]